MKALWKYLLTVLVSIVLSWLFFHVDDMLLNTDQVVLDHIDSDYEARDNIIKAIAQIRERVDSLENNEIWIVFPSNHPCFATRDEAIAGAGKLIFYIDHGNTYKLLFSEGEDGHYTHYLISEREYTCWVKWPPND